MKKLLIAFLALLMLAGLCSCGGKTVDIDALADDLLASGAFSDTLSEPAAGVAERLYDIQSGAASHTILYVSSGSTAEEIFLVEAATDWAVGVLQDNCTARVSAQKEAFVNYAPAEVQKLDNAIVTSVGKYVILVVAADADAARAVVDRYV